MNVVWSSDENYVQHLAVSMMSLLKHNRDVERIDCYVISNNITPESCEELNRLAAGFGRGIHWIDFTPFKEQLELNMAWPISISAYARLFLQEMLPDTVQRVLYLDCDTVVCASLQELFTMDLEGDCVGGVQDFISNKLKKAVDISPDATYINSGILLIDLECWRTEQMLERFLGYINEQNGTVIHHDQGVINHCLQGNIRILPPRYNAMTPIFTLTKSGIQAIWGEYYPETKYREAIENPAIIHFTPAFTGRVWDIKCKHPLRDRYTYYLDRTIWKGKYTDEHISAKFRVINWLALHMPRVYARIL